MKKIFIVIIFFAFFLVQNIKADQLAWITKDQAEQTVNYFGDNNIKEVVLYCGCCDKDKKEKVNITKIYYRQVKDSNEYYEVVIEGTTLNSKMINKAVDLAYVHILKGHKWKCLGKELGFECDPCTAEFIL